MPAPAEAAGREGEEEEELPIDLFGLIAMVGFTLLIVVTLNRKARKPAHGSARMRYRTTWGAGSRPGAIIYAARNPWSQRFPTD